NGSNLSDSRRACGTSATLGSSPSTGSPAATSSSAAKAFRFQRVLRMVSAPAGFRTTGGRRFDSLLRAQVVVAGEYLVTVKNLSAAGHRALSACRPAFELPEGFAGV